MAQESFDLSGLLQSLQGEDLSALLETAGALFGAGAADPAPKDAPSKASPQEEAAFSMPDPALLLKLTQLFSLLSHKQRDPRTDLLFALRPLVRPEKQQRIDMAAQMLQLLQILPQLRELGL